MAVVSEFDRLPLHRQAEMMASRGLCITARRSPAGSVRRAALLDQVAGRIRDEVLKANKIHAGGTPVPMLDPGRGKTATGRLRVYTANDLASGSRTPPVNWYHFTPDRTATHSQTHLAGFRRFLKADAYAGYDGSFRGGVTEVAC